MLADHSPFECVAETVILPSERILPVGDRDACVLRNRTLPVVHLRELLGAERVRASEAKMMVAEAGGERVAIVVDDFGERIEAMIRPASGLLAGMPGISGTTLLGNGDVMLVLDPEALIT
jgi:two-component system, chemotaxis family, sensor kinase CheA